MVDLVPDHTFRGEVCDIEPVLSGDRNRTSVVQKIHPWYMGTVLVKPGVDAD